MNFSGIFTRLFDKGEIRGTEKCLSVIDMQTFFLSKRPEFIKMCVKKLTVNIIGEIEFYKDMGYDIMLVEYDDHGDTLPEIKSALGKYRYKLLKKDCSGLMSSRKHEKRNNEAASIIKSAGSLVELSGVNATGCVASTAHGFTHIQIKTLLKLKNTLSVCDYDEFEFMEYNEIGCLIRCLGGDLNNLGEGALNRGGKVILKGSYSDIDITGYDPAKHKYASDL
ncbi:MAG: hypothetical protein PHS92_01090 [Candidatus Gracilibacteria bacterium]|nr:hypothetical protein [Candidatus Gracilibacteria bacterium]